MFDLFWEIALFTEVQWSMKILVSTCRLSVDWEFQLSVWYMFFKTEGRDVTVFLKFHGELYASVLTIQMIKELVKFLSAMAPHN